MRLTLPTTLNMRTACGEFCSRPSGCSRNSAPGSSANQAQCISSGAASTCALRVSAVAALRGEMESLPARHIRMSAAAWAGGPAAGTSRGRLFMHTWRRSRQGIEPDRVLPAGSLYQDQMHEFLLMYDEARRSKSPGTEILEFAQRTYEAGADLAGWDRAALERVPVPHR